MTQALKFTRMFSLLLAVTLTAGVVCAEAPKPAPAKKPAPAYKPGPMLQRMLNGPMKHFDEIVFAVRVPGRDHWYVTFGNYSCTYGPPKERAFKEQDGVLWGYGEGGRLCKMNLRTGKIVTLLDDPKGGVRDPQMHYSGKKILFSYRPGGTHTFHLYEINVDGSGLKQLTDGPDDDIEPTYCPDGSIVFCSSRCRRFVNCWYSRVATLYRCDADGSNVRMLSSNNDHDNTPWVLPDGRVLYMRWEYVDRSQVHYHHLWTTNPDGTAQMVYYGNLKPGIAMLDAKPIPGTDKIVSVFSPGHGRPEHLGSIAVVDPNLGPDDPAAVKVVNKRNSWKDPYALSEDCFLVADPKGLYVMDGSGATELVYQLPEAERKTFQLHEPRPVRGRPIEQALADRVDLKDPTGTLILQNVYEGRNMEGVKPGAIDKLLVLKQLPKPVNFSGGMEPLTIGGSFTLAEIVGTVPVEPDGSAYMQLPALQSLFFVALDKQDRPVKRMHSFLVLQPGEKTSCVGCHEQRTQAPSSGGVLNLQAVRKSPAKVQPIKDIPRVIDFPRDIQPILDEHCVKCHRAEKYEGRVDLTGDKTQRYTMSYRTIIHRGLINDARNKPTSNYEPYSYGSVVSPLMKLIDGSHYGAKVSDHQRKMIRLWIETSATYPGTYASLGNPDAYAHLPGKEMTKRCGSCHLHDKKLSFPGGRVGYPMTVVNVSRPEMSRVLRGPLAKEAGGLGACKEIVFKDTKDPLYQQILTSIRHAHESLMKIKRFDMPGFRPNEHYIREMQRFGFIRKDLPADAPVDVYKVDRAYWDSFRWKVDKKSPDM
ncbi:hypothetical protein HED60_00200 [Planctomycetales bacterium ZRK34]|nr:hypothetical protein HED60_00200 [Planctomycetales bacterium ZRK34]